MLTHIHNAGVALVRKIKKKKFDIKLNFDAYVGILFSYIYVRIQDDLLDTNSVNVLLMNFVFCIIGFFA